MSNPLISIVVTCYNRRHYLEQTMASVFAQRYRPVEIVVLDDGSTDDTQALMRRYGDRIRYYRQENQGIAVTRTNAARLARGEYIAFQDDDDLMPPNRIVLLYEALRRYPPAVLATGDYAFIDPEGNLTGERWQPLEKGEEEREIFIEDGYRAILWPEIPTAPHTTLFRKNDGERIGWFDPLFTYACSDKDFFLRLTQLGAVVYLRKIMSYYRRGHAQIWSNEILANYYRLLLYEKHLLFINSEKKELRNRLQFLIRIALQKIAFSKSQGIQIEDPAIAEYIEKGIALLGVKNRIAYKWYDLIKLPVRKMVRGTEYNSVTPG